MAIEGDGAGCGGRVACYSEFKTDDVAYGSSLSEHSCRECSVDAHTAFNRWKRPQWCRVIPVLVKADAPRGACGGGQADERGGAAAGAGGEADAARGRQQDGLLRREPQARPIQALYGAGVARWQDSEPGQLCHRGGGGAVHRANAGGAGGGGREGCSGAAADERGGAAAGAGKGADATRGRQQGGLLWRAPHESRPAQALSGEVDTRWEASEPGQLRHRRGGRVVRRAVAGGAGGGAGGVSAAAAEERGGEPGQPPRHAVPRSAQGREHSLTPTTRRIHQGGGGRPAHAAARCGCQTGARGRRRKGWAEWSPQEAKGPVKICSNLCYSGNLANAPRRTGPLCVFKTKVRHPFRNTHFFYYIILAYLLARVQGEGHGGSPKSPPNILLTPQSTVLRCGATAQSAH
eukprot:scaffold33336_cov66-Phaeocystis_antarctica.AAC.3